MYLYDVKQFYILYRICRAKDDDFVTSLNLAEELHITSKTIKSMISDMSDYAFDHGFSIVSKKGSGYSVDICDATTFFAFRKRLYAYFNKYSSSLLQHDTRVMYLLMYLLQVSKPVGINRLMDLFSVSNSTIYNDIYKGKKIIQSLNIVQGNKVSIEESEFFKRNKLCLLYNHLLYSEGIEMLFNDPYYKEYEPLLKEPEKYYSIIGKDANDYSVSLSTEAIDLLLLYCLLANVRYDLNKHLNLTCDIDKLSALNEYRCAEKILSDFHLHNKKDKQELAALTILLLIYNSNHFNAEDRYPFYYTGLNRFVTSLSEQLNERFSGSLNAIPYIQLFLFQIFARIYFALYFDVYRFSFDNLTYRTENTNNQVIIELSRYLAEIIELETGKQLSHSLIHMLSFSLSAIFTTIPDAYVNMKLLVVPKESEVYWPFIMRKLENSLPQKPIIQFANEYELSNIQVKDYDMLLTNYRSLFVENKTVTYFDLNEDVNVSLLKNYMSVYNHRNYNYRSFLRSFDHVFIHDHYFFEGIDDFFDDLLHETTEIITLSSEYLKSKNNLLNYYTQDGIVVIPNITNNLGTSSVLSIYRLEDSPANALWRERTISLIIFINYDINNDIYKMKKLVNFADYILKYPEWQRHLKK